MNKKQRAIVDRLKKLLLEATEVLTPEEIEYEVKQAVVGAIFREHHKQEAIDAALREQNA